MGPVTSRRRSRALVRTAACVFEELESLRLLSVFVVTNTGDNGTGTLRQAILDSDTSSTTGVNVIDFDIPGGGVQTIEPLTPLPPILEPTMIDGYSQPGSSVNTLTTADNAVIDIDISGAIVGSTGVGLDVFDASASGSTIDGLAINGFATGLIIVNGANDNTISGNFIGTDATGTTNSANGTGLGIGSANNTIGGVSPASANLISGNTGDGVVFNQSAATGNVVFGNDIGQSASGAPSLGNAGSGVVVSNGASDNTIGGTAAGDGNVITASGGDGVLIASTTGLPISSGNTVVGNSIYGNSNASTHGLGIDLTGYPAEPGAGNNDEPSPDLTSAILQSSGLIITGNFQGTGSGTLSLDVYTSGAVDASGAGEGQTYLGRFAVSNGTGTVSLGSIDVPGTFSPGQYITATLTDSGGNTSEFSDAVGTTPPIEPPIEVTNTNDSGAGSLRAAIIAADHDYVGVNVIDFDIPGSGVQTIEPLAPLPPIMEPTIIDGYSQPGASPNTLAVGDNAVVLIDLNGSNVAAGFFGLHIYASDTVVRGLAIGGFQGVPATATEDSAGGIGILTESSATNITIAGNFIGTDATCRKQACGKRLQHQAISEVALLIAMLFPGTA